MDDFKKAEAEESWKYYSQIVQELKIEKLFVLEM